MPNTGVGKPAVAISRRALNKIAPGANSAAYQIVTPQNHAAPRTPENETLSLLFTIPKQKVCKKNNYDGIVYKDNYFTV